MVLPSDLLDHAQAMLNGVTDLPIPPNECIWRSIVGRAYYAVYHEALFAAQRKGYKFEDTRGLGRHEALWEWWFDKQTGEVEIYGQGESLRSKRIRADYNLSSTSSKALAIGVVEEAKELFEMIGDYRNR